MKFVQASKPLKARGKSALQPRAKSSGPSSARVMAEPTPPAQDAAAVPPRKKLKAMNVVCLC